LIYFLLYKNIIFIKRLNYFILINIYIKNFSFSGDWGLGIGDWGFGGWGADPKPQNPNPQSPIPN